MSHNSLVPSPQADIGATPIPNSAAVRYRSRTAFPQEFYEKEREHVFKKPGYMWAASSGCRALAATSLAN